ncbi:MAG: family 10 glycosylhydrolase [Cyanobacteria bacterium J06621_8]
MLEIRGVWIANRPHSQVLASRSNIAAALDFLQSYGFNVIFPVVWNRGYTLYPSQLMSNYLLPKIAPDYTNRDPLGEIIIEAHQRNIKVIPWLEYGFAASHLPNGGEILQQYPHWRGVEYGGTTARHGGLTWMNAFHPEVQQFILALITEILTLYDVDGIQGCDRLPASTVTAGYDDYTVQQYQSAVGKPPPQNCQDRHWLQWRADCLTDFLATMYRQVKAIKPKAIFSLSPGVYPFCLNHLLQDSKAWVEKGLVDWMHPQIYRPNFWGYKREVKQLVNTLSDYWLSKTAPGIAFTANGQQLKPQEIIKCIQINRQHHLGGQVFFHYEGLRQNYDAMAIALLPLWKNNK